MGGANLVPLAVFGLGVAGGALMILTDFSLVRSVRVLTASCEALAQPSLQDTCETTGGEAHSYALVLLGLFSFAMAYGAGLGASRPAAIALLAAGAIVLLIALAIDLPKAGETGAVGQDFEQAEAIRGVGVTFEILGAALAIAAGALRLFRPRREPGSEKLQR
ncbi:MAG: hypothetical protein H0T15_09205 [Thermoleophilaceae bacterium]|nr:hypothetical protein [Thermoleophilaceae bacterium]